jgi:periplasmic divalent cation tolerance protein
MKSTKKHVVVMVTVPDAKTGRAVARALLKAKLVACANIVPQIESHYWWQGKLETSKEQLLLIKTTQAQLQTLNKMVRAHHPYDTPEVIALPIVAGSRRYLDWINESVGRPVAKAK